MSEADFKYGQELLQICMTLHARVSTQQLDISSDETIVLESLKALDRAQ